MTTFIIVFILALLFVIGTAGMMKYFDNKNMQKLMAQKIKESEIKETRIKEDEDAKTLEDKKDVE